jgi:hypothetical protein
MRFNPLLLAVAIAATPLQAQDSLDDARELLKNELPLNDRGWNIALRGTLSHARAENPFEILDGETIDGTWEAYSGQVGAGLIIPVTDALSCRLAGQFS